MSRQLLLLRHAKSAWPVGVPDADRPLAPRGERDTLAVGRFLAGRALVPDHVVSSPARRAHDTALRVLAAAGQDAAVLSVDGRLYDGDPFAVLREVPDEAQLVMLVGHEPELLDVLRTTCGADVRFPTAALAVIELEAPWPLQPAGRGVLRALVTPKLLPPGN